MIEHATETSGLFDIGTEKICNCPNNHINCLSAKEWLKSQIGVWRFAYEKRDVRDKKLHPATFPIALAKKSIELFTHEGELVVDPFCGSGTTLLASQDLNRNAVGFDLQQSYVALACSRLDPSTNSFTKRIAINDDSRNINHYLKEDSITHICTSPPYANVLNKKRKNKSMRNRTNDQLNKIEQYSQNPNDLGTLDIELFTHELGVIFMTMHPLIRHHGHVMINICDIWSENKRIPLHMYIIEELSKCGYELRNIIIWDKTNIVNQVGIFGWPNNYITMGITFEHILDFWKV